MVVWMALTMVVRMVVKLVEVKAVKMVDMLVWTKAELMAELKDAKKVKMSVVKMMDVVLDASLGSKVLEDYTYLMRQHHLR